MMRKLVRIACLAVVALGLGYGALTVRPGGMAHADSGISQFCSKYGDFGFTHGACVSYFESKGNSSALFASFCQQYYTYFGLANVGQCVSYLNQEYKSL